MSALILKSDHTSVTTATRLSLDLIILPNIGKHTRGMPLFLENNTETTVGKRTWKARKRTFMVSKTAPMALRMDTCLQ